MTGVITTEFDPPDEPWLAGHRGLDIAAAEGSPVRATAPGLVVWVGTVGATTSLSVELADGRRHTFQPVDPLVSVGQRVQSGQTIATLAPGDHCLTSCLHWGLKRGNEYFDPRATTQIRLLPQSSEPSLRVTAPRPEGHSARFALPIRGPVTSRFGMRFHPVTGVYKLHDGVDIAAPCGTPVASPRAGRVAAVYTNVAWGNRVVIDHGVIQGRPFSTTYNHLESLPPLRIGQSLAAGARIGEVGSTGYSTGCHLHWGMLVNGTAVDPLGG